MRKTKGKESLHRLIATQVIFERVKRDGESLRVEDSARSGAKSWEAASQKRLKRFLSLDPSL